MKAIREIIQEEFVRPREAQWRLGYAKSVIDGRLKGEHHPHQMLNFYIIITANEQKIRIVEETIHQMAEKEMIQENTDNGT